MHKGRLVVSTSIFMLLALCAPGLAFASAPRTEISPTSFNFVEGSMATVQVSLDEPIICEDPNAVCNVVLNFTSSDPSRVTVSPSSLTFPANAWSAPQDLTLSAVTTDTFNNGETVTIASAPIVSASEFYSGSQPANISVSLPPAAAPVLGNQTVNVVSDGASVVTNVLAGASGYPDASSLSIISGPSHGTAVDPPGTITYTPNAGYSGPDSLTYQVCSSLEASVCSTGILRFNVSAPPPDTGYGSPPDHTYMRLFAVSLGLMAFPLIARKINKQW